MPLSRRAAAWAFGALGVGVAVLLVVFVWPGYYSYVACRSAGAPTDNFGGRTYCAQVVPLPDDQANYTEWSYGFHLRTAETPGGIGLNVTVAEPGGRMYAGSLFCGAICPRNRSETWFTPDENAGVWWAETGSEVENVTLLVSAT